MKQIRINTFETNSSSTHSIVIATAEDYNKWKSGGIYINVWNNELKTKEEIYREFENDNKDNLTFEGWLFDTDYTTWEDWEPDLAHDYEEFTTPGGETICVECAYGYE